MEVPPGLLARTTEASSTVTGSNFFHSFKLVRDYYKSLYKANLGPVYMEVGDPRLVS